MEFRGFGFMEFRGVNLRWGFGLRETHFGLRGLESLGVSGVGNLGSLGFRVEGI